MNYKHQIRRERLRREKQGTAGRKFRNADSRPFRVIKHNEGLRERARYIKLTKKAGMSKSPQGFRVKCPKERGAEDRALGISSRLYHFEGQPDAIKNYKHNNKFRKPAITSGKKVWRKK